MNTQLDEIDKRILYELVADARNTSAPMIAEKVDVSPATIRNRITELEESDIIEGYHAAINYEQCEGRLTNLFSCHAPVKDRGELIQQTLQIPGVVGVSELRTGQRNVQIKAVARDTTELTRIATQLDSLGLEIREERLIEQEYVSPYHPFGPDESLEGDNLADFMSLTGSAEVAEVTVHEDAPMTDTTLEKANDEGLLGDDVLIIAIEREGEILTPDGATEIQRGDIISVFSRGGIPHEVFDVFTSMSQT